VNNVTYLGPAFDRRMVWRFHIERTVTKALPTYIRTYSLFKYERLSTNIKFTLYKALIRMVTTYACPTWEYVSDASLETAASAEFSAILETLTDAYQSSKCT
jgi:hypothetical protein